MGWIAFTKDGEQLVEDTHGRPVQQGEEGQLLAIAQEDFGKKVAIDLTRGIVFIDYDTIDVSNGYLQITGNPFVFFICQETNRLADSFEIVLKSAPDQEGWYTQEYEPLIWRPIWFTRWTNGMPTKVIGAQTTLPTELGGKNHKKIISLFMDGTIGID